MGHLTVVFFTSVTSRLCTRPVWARPPKARPFLRQPLGPGLALKECRRMWRWISSLCEARTRSLSPPPSQWPPLEPTISRAYLSCRLCIFWLSLPPSILSARLLIGFELRGHFSPLNRSRKHGITSTVVWSAASRSFLQHLVLIF